MNRKQGLPRGMPGQPHPARRGTVFFWRTLTSAIVLLGLFGLLSLTPMSEAEAQGKRPTISLAGRLLVAKQRLRDPNFVQTVIFMLEHDKRGAMGFVINRPLGAVPADKLLDKMGVEGGESGTEIPVHYGGPVEPGRGFVLHTQDLVLDTTRVLAQDFALTTDTEILRNIAGGNAPKGFRFVLGYSGWAPGQLENEIARGDWFDVHADSALVFDRDSEAIWDKVMAASGVEL